MNGTYYNDEAAERARQDVYVISAIAMVVGLTAGTVIALLTRPKKRPAHEQFLLSAEKVAGKALEGGKEATVKVIEGLQQEVDRLRKEVIERR